MMMNAISSNPTNQFQYVNTSGKTKAEQGLKEKLSKQFEKLDTNHDGKIDFNEAKQSGGLFGKNLFTVTDADQTKAWRATSGIDGALSFREFAALALYIDGTKTQKKPQNTTDGFLTEDETDMIKADLNDSITKSSTVTRPDGTVVDVSGESNVTSRLNRVIDDNAIQFGLDAIIPPTDEQRTIALLVDADDKRTTADVSRATAQAKWQAELAAWLIRVVKTLKGIQ
jgi:hypothetical protein